MSAHYPKPLSRLGKCDSSVERRKEMKLTDKEMKLIDKEYSYRAQRTGYLGFAIIFSLPIAILTIIACKVWLDYIPENQHVFAEFWRNFDYSKLKSSALFFIVFFFLGYRAQSKLTLIRHLKQHMSEPKN